MKKWFKFQYPKLLIFILTILIAYILFKNPVIYNFLSSLGKLSYLGVFITGMLMAFGFTAPIAIGLFIVLTPQNILLASLIGGARGINRRFIYF